MKISKTKLARVFSRLSKRSVLVIGDYMLDAYVWGSVKRISPEAPVPVVDVHDTTYLPGGAANVVQNLHKLGVKAIPIGVAGDDRNSRILLQKFAEMKIDTSGIVIDKHRPTTTKTRIMAQNQQVVRYDEEDREDVSTATQKKLLARIKSYLGSIDAVIFEDYNKGVITDKVARESISLLKRKRVFVAVDPKKKNFDSYKGASLVKPNRAEAAEMAGLPIENLEDGTTAAKKVRKNLSLGSVLVTLGKEGMVLCEKSGRITQLPSMARKVFDVTGAGDTVIGAVAAFVAAGASIREAAFLANYAAGIVVAEVGTAAVTPGQIKKAIR